MECRAGCGACCIAPSISPCEALPEGKAAGVRCPHLTDDVKCALFGKPERPTFCASLRPTMEMCGSSREDAMHGLSSLEAMTRPE